MATARENGSAEPHSLQISLVAPGFEAVLVCEFIEGVKGNRKREEVGVWAYPFLAGCSTHHFVVPAVDKTAVL